MIKYTFFLLVVLFSNVAVKASNNDAYKNSDFITEIYRPNYVNSAQLLPILLNLYSDEGYFSADNQQLILRARQETLKDIQSLLLQLDHPVRTFSVHLSHQKNIPGSKHYSLTHRHQLTQHVSYSIVENSTLTVIKEQRQQQLRQALPWLRVASVPIKGEYLSLNLQSGNNNVYITITQRVLNNGKFQTITQTISGPFSQWLPITSTLKNNTAARYQTTQRDKYKISFIKVDKTN